MENAERSWRRCREGDSNQKISGHRVFRDFTWFANLQPFGRFNLIYGWNGSGKTTISSLFHHLQTHSAVAEGDVEFEIDGAKVSGRDLETAPLPSVRVFNRDFIASTILAAGGRMDAIYYFGEDSVEKQKQVEKLKDELDRAEKEVMTARTEKSEAEKGAGRLLHQQGQGYQGTPDQFADTTVHQLRQEGVQAIDRETGQGISGFALLRDEDKEKLRKQKDSAQLRTENSRRHR